MRLKALARRIPCLSSSEHGDNNELEISGDEIIGDGLIKKGKENQLEVAIGDGMEFTIHGDIKNKKKNKLMNSTKVSSDRYEFLISFNDFVCNVVF